MDPSSLPQVAVEHLYPFLVLAALLIVGLGLVVVLVLRAISASDARTAAIVRTELRSQDHRKMIVEGSVDALRTREGREELRYAAAEALHGLAEPLTSTQAEQGRRQAEHAASLREHGQRLGQLETWRASTEVLVQSVAEHGRKLNALERGWVRVVEILKRHKMTTSEETGQ